MFKRWKINSIDYGGKILAGVGILFLAIPLALYGCSRLLGLFWIGSSGLLRTIRISFYAGLALLAFFALLLAVEFIQDRLLDKAYLRNKNRKLPLGNGMYECQYCGSRELRQSDKECLVCGKAFQE